MKPTEDVMRAAFVAALWYHPDATRALATKVRSGAKLESTDSWAGDTFAGLYTNALRFPPDEYEHWRSVFFKGDRS